LLIGAGFGLFQFLQQQKTASEQQRISSDQFLQQQRSVHNLQISNQASKGFEQLAGEKMEMRLGGIYALERVMNAPNSPYRVPVLEALCAFVRDHVVARPPPGFLPPLPPRRSKIPETVVQLRKSG
jgi:hypothetical protein